MSLSVDILNQVLEKIRKVKVMSIPQFTAMLQCSARTVQRRLKQWRCYNSYNHNGGYYALPEVVKFDGNGIWRYDGIFFSKFGNLKQTVAGVIGVSHAGLSARELSDLLGLNAHSFLSQFANANVMRREKIGPHYVYLSFDSIRAQAQQQNRLADGKLGRGNSRLSHAAVVTVLVTLLKKPDVDVDQLTASLRMNGLWGMPKLVAELLQDHDLALKKTRDDTHRRR